MLRLCQISALLQKAFRLGWGQPYIDEMLSVALNIDSLRGTYIRRDEDRDRIENKWKGSAMYKSPLPKSPAKKTSNWEDYVAKVRKSGTARHNAELDTVLERMKSLCVCSRETLRQRFMGNYPI